MPTNYRKKVLRIACPISIACDGDNTDPDVGMCSKCKAALEKRKRGLKPPKGMLVSGELKRGQK